MSDQGLHESLERAEARRLMAIKLADRDVHQADIEVLDEAEYRDGGYWVAARIWVDSESVEHGCGFDVALASDFVADVDGRDARFTRTDDGEDDGQIERMVEFEINGARIIAPIGEPLSERQVITQNVMGGMVTATGRDGSVYALWMFGDGYKARQVPA